MNILDLLMILRLQIGCLFIILLIAIPCFMIRCPMDFAHKIFRFLISFQILSLVFDIITVYTVNHVYIIPPLLNKLCHIIFISSLCCFIYLTFLYVRNLITEDNCKKRLLIFGIPLCLAIIAVIFAPLHYMETPWGNYSAGPGATIVYATVGIYLIMMLYIILRYWRIIESDKRRVILIAVLSEIFFSMLQLFIPTILMSGLGTTIITLGIYLTLENPDRVLKDIYYEENLNLLDKIHYDVLTNIYNRRFMEERLGYIMKSPRYSGLLSVLMMDIDFFKQYNDTYGHSAGDECLKIVADTLHKSVSRTDDFVARYGGEEFVAILPNTDAKGAQIMAERILNNIRACNIPHENSAAANCVTISIGVATGKRGYKKKGEDFIKRADEALYISKQSGRNKYTFLVME